MQECKHVWQRARYLSRAKKLIVVCSVIKCSRMTWPADRKSIASQLQD